MAKKGKGKQPRAEGEGLPFHLEVAEERRRAEAGLTWDELKSEAAAEVGEPAETQALIADLFRRGLLGG